MRIVIDKDCSEIQLLNESYELEKMLPDYKVLAVEADGEKFIYAKGLKINEATDAVYDLAFDPNFDGCQSEIVEIDKQGNERIVWSSDTKVQVCESVLADEAAPAGGNNKAAGNKKAGNNKKDAKTGQNKPGFWDKVKGAAKAVGDAAKKALDGLSKGLNIVGAMTKQFSKDALTKWREGGLFNKEGRITGLGYKVMTGQVKNTIPVDTGNGKKDDITQAWKIAQSNAVNALKKQGFTVNGEVKAIVKNDKDPITLSADVTDKDGNAQTIEFNQDGTMVDGGAQNAENADGAGGNNGGNGGGNNGGNNDGGNGGNGGNGGGGANTQKITPDQAEKNPKAALGNLATRMARVEQELGLAAESYDWNYDGQVSTNKAGLERLTIKRFFNELNDTNVKEIKFVSESGEVKTYETAKGSSAYADFKKDFKESTSNAVGKCAGYKVTIESGNKSNLKGFKFSNFGMNDDFDSTSKTVVIKESWTKFTPDDEDTSKKKSDESELKTESTPLGAAEPLDAILADANLTVTNPKDGEYTVMFAKGFKGPSEALGNSGWGVYNYVKNLVGDETFKAMKTPSVFDDSIKLYFDKKASFSESFTLELDKQDPSAKVKELVASINRYGGHMDIPDFDAAVSTGVSTYPDVKDTVDVDKKVVDGEKIATDDEKAKTEDVVTEAEGDEEADPFAGGDDAGGDDAGGDAGGGEADPFADAGGGEGGDAGAEGGDAGGGEADPFAGGDDAGGEGGDAGADAAGGADAAADPAADGGDEAVGEPAAPDAVNTDAQGNEKSQYNINVTKPFNSDNDFNLNEEEQKEFFGKIDQLVKIPDMDNYSLYLYQITPENMNLDDVHYIEALYQLSVKLGLLEDVYADSNLLEKYNSYKYSIVKDGEQENNEELQVQESRVVLEKTAKVQKDNEKKTKDSKKVGSSKDDEERRGPKDMKLEKDKNGADKPVIIDTTKEGWDSLNGKEHGKDIESTTEGDFHGLGWIATFKAMQFGSPRYMSLYIKKNGDEKAEEQCRKYLEQLSYKDIEFVNIEEVDPYEYIYRQSCSGMKTPEEIRTAKYANEGVPVTYLESETKVPESIPGDIKRDVKRVITKLNAEIRGTKQFNFLKECGIPKPQIDHTEFLTHYKTAQVNETLSETTYKFVLRKNDSTLSRMFFSNMKEKLFKYLGSFAQKFGMECGCECTPTCVVIDFMRSNLDPMGYDLDTMVDTDVELPPSPIENDVAEVMK